LEWRPAERRDASSAPQLQVQDTEPPLPGQPPFLLHPVSPTAAAWPAPMQNSPQKAKEDPNLRSRAEKQEEGNASHLITRLHTGLKEKDTNQLSSENIEFDSHGMLRFSPLLFLEAERDLPRGLLSSPSCSHSHLC